MQTPSFSVGIEEEYMLVDPETRTLLRVDIDDGAMASRLFDELMGSEVEPRKLFIEKNAKYVKNLDV